MLEDQIVPVLSALFSYGFEGVVAGLVVFLMMKYFLPGYLSEKGKNLATREDIEHITDKVESVKTDYAEILEEVKSKNQIKIDAIEREKALKKEVYMEAVEAITLSQNMLTNLSNLNIKDDQLTSAFSANAGKIAKVQLVGGQDTVKAVTQFMGEVASNFLDLILDRSLLLQRQAQIESLQSLRNQHQSEVERCIHVMKALNLEGMVNQGAWEYIDQSFKFECEERDKLDHEVEELWTVQIQEHLGFMRRVMDTFYEVSEKLPDAILAVRSELNLEIDEENYRDIFRDNIEKGRRILNEFFAKVEAQQSLSIK